MPRKMKDFKLDAEEQEILDAFERRELKSVPNAAEEIAMLQQAARNFFKKEARMNIRVTKQDILGLKHKAAEEGIPYQTLAASILHKYVTGQLKPVGKKGN